MRRRIILSLLIFAVSLAYLLLSYSHGPHLEYNGNTTELYAELADSLLAGHTSLPIEPRPELLALPDPYDQTANWAYRLHDAALYNGKYYLYHGVVPALVLFAPFKVLTGSRLSNRVAAPLFCIGGFVCACVFFFVLVKREGWDCPFWLEILAVIALGASAGIGFALRRAMFYEVAVTSGYCFVMAGYMFALFSLRRGSVWQPSLLLSGLMFGMAGGCRPHLILVALLMCAWMALPVWRDWRASLSFVAPIALCGLGLAVYNFQRFDNPAEFGVRYLLTTTPYARPSVQIVPSALAPGLFEYLVRPPVFDRSFPFAHPAMVYGFVGYSAPSRWHDEPMAGVLAASPLALLGLLAPLLLRLRGASGGIGVAGARMLRSMCICACVVLALLCLNTWTVGRYEVDFAPLLVLIGTCMMVLYWQTARDAAHACRKRFAAGATLVILASAGINFAMAMPRWELVQQFLTRR